MSVDAQRYNISPAANFNPVITDEYGVKYNFRAREYSKSRPFGEAGSNNIAYPTSWYLTKMENANHTNTIEFDYDTYYHERYRMTTNFDSGDHEIDSYIIDAFIGKRLKIIHFSEGSVEFKTSSSIRKDLPILYPSIYNDYALEEIVVKNLKGNIIKKIKFNYKYFTEDGLVNDSASLTVSNNNRLVLNSISQIIGTESKVLYEFKYENTQFLPSLFSKAIDHWGYYNGAQSNTTLLPKKYYSWNRLV